MFGRPVSEGALFYGKTRRRIVVAFDGELRALTARVAAEVRANLAACRTPPPVHSPACKHCSLAEICRPQRLETPSPVARWLAAQLAD